MAIALDGDVFDPQRADLLLVPGIGLLYMGRVVTLTDRLASVQMLRAASGRSFPILGRDHLGFGQTYALPAPLPKLVWRDAEGCLGAEQQVAAARAAAGGRLPTMGLLQHVQGGVAPERDVSHGFLVPPHSGRRLLLFGCLLGPAGRLPPSLPLGRVGARWRRRG